MPDLQQVLNQILHEPLSYMHEARLHLPAMLGGEAQANIINKILINRLQLNTECSVLIPGSMVAHVALNWLHLPQTAFLMSCQRQRARLARQGGLQRLPAWARQFAVLDLSPAQASVGREAINLNDLLKQSYIELSAWQGMLPLALQQRLALLFPPFVDDIQAERPPSPADPLLFTLALQYAQRHPNAPAYHSR
jgi:type III secretion system OrgA/MxiK family protein